MRNLVLPAAPLILLWSSIAYCQDASESALGDPAPQVLQDPSVSNSRHFSPSQSTAGVAAVLPGKAGHGTRCSATNPCALPTPARDRVVVAQDKS
jgi:hypothetical protein